MYQQLLNNMALPSVQLAEYLVDKRKILGLFQEFGIVNQAESCCGTEVAIVRRREKFQFKCYRCRKRVSVTCKTYLENCRLSFEQLLTTLFCWSHELPVGFCEFYSGTSRPTSIAWYEFCRNICTNALLERGEAPLGGEGTVVEIDESLFQKKRKYHRGSRGVTPGLWVFGLVDRETKEVRLEVVEKRDKDTLLPIIRKNVRRGTTIYSDDWASYRGLKEELGVNHFVVIHKKEFKRKLEDGTEVHTNTIEGYWGNIKRKLKFMRGTSREKLPGYLDEYMFRSLIPRDTPFLEHFLRTIAHQNPPGKLF